MASQGRLGLDARRSLNGTSTESLHSRKVCPMKTIFLALFAASVLSISALGQDAASESSSANLKALVLSLDWTQCEGRFHYTFAANGTFSLDGTILGGTWSLEHGGALTLQWSGNWIVDHLKFDTKRQQFLHSKGDACNILGVPSTTRLAER
jgi:hypothetical protein